MEDGLVPTTAKVDTDTVGIVLILVVMEDGLVRHTKLCQKLGPCLS